MNDGFVRIQNGYIPSQPHLNFSQTANLQPKFHIPPPPLNLPPWYLGPQIYQTPPPPANYGPQYVFSASREIEYGQSPMIPPRIPLHQRTFPVNRQISVTVNQTESIHSPVTIKPEEPSYKTTTVSNAPKIPRKPFDIVKARLNQNFTGRSGTISESLSKSVVESHESPSLDLKPTTKLETVKELDEYSGTESPNKQTIVTASNSKTQSLKPSDSTNPKATSTSVQIQERLQKSLPVQPSTKLVLDLSQCGEEIKKINQKISLAKNADDKLSYAKYLIAKAEEIKIENEKNRREAAKMQKKMIDQGLSWIRKLAHGGHYESLLFLGDCFGSGYLGMKIDAKKSFRYYKRAAKGNAEAAFRVAVCYESGAGTRRDDFRAVKYYHTAARLENVVAMYKYGITLVYGLLSQTPNMKLGLPSIERAAKNSYPKALYELGMLYEGRGAELDPNFAGDEKFAFENYYKAASLGHLESQLRLGRCYELGQLGKDVDPGQSIRWYRRAAEQGDAEAELALSGWYFTGTKDGVLQRDMYKAYFWSKKAASKGLTKAQFAVGHYLENNIGIPEDETDLDYMNWYRKAAQQGFPKAIQRLKDLEDNRSV
ncbi:hypothetical protein HK098_007847 [Nowakowskiella sp. JEL0407]|nr:hypothetical protein HK098_007847 [Nowakowskiella sp. JEL0407]